MLDKILTGSIRGVVFGLICLTMVLALFFGYHGMIRLISDEPIQGAIDLAVGLSVAAAALLLCRHRTDLSFV